MKRIRVKASGEYEILIGSGLLASAGERIAPLVRGRSITLVSDDNVYPLYGERLRAALGDFRVNEYVIPHGEGSKSLEEWGSLLGFMCERHMTRSDAVVALGGGVVGDLSGFAAACYQRGIAYVQVPTSLLAAVDSSVGGKTAVNLPAGKNCAGSFHQPSLVLCDTDTLGTLPETEYRNGCAEIIKYAMLDGPELFGQLSVRPVRDCYEDIIEKCVSIKRSFVEEDEFDTGRRMLLNLGHTMGHAVEACSGFAIPHGQAVAMGMAAVAEAAAEMGFCSHSVYKRLTELLRLYSLPCSLPYGAKELYAAALSDKKSTGRILRLIVPRDIGCCMVENVEERDFMDWLKKGGAR